MDNLINVKKAEFSLKGTIKVPADKSISHRAAIFGALVGNPVSIVNFSAGADCKSTLSVLQQLGADIKYTSKNDLTILCKEFIEPDNVLDAGNSGTTIRLMSGVLSGQNFYSVLTGDDSLRKRPMARIIVPLNKMGANIWARTDNTRAPISIKGTKLKGISYDSPISSAQIKSALILAGLFAEGITTVKEPVKSRDHTERLLKYLDANITVDKNNISIEKSTLTPKSIIIPGDISSAAFFMVAASIVPDSEIIIKDVGLNPTRTGIIKILKKMGADIEILNQNLVCGEEVGDLRVKYSELKGITIEKEDVPSLIDELPIIAVAATQAEGATTVRGAEDLRHKESDRIKAIYNELTKLGADIEETPDGFKINGKTRLKGDCILETYHDHRIAMVGYIAGLVCDKPIQINEFHWVNISFPEFVELFDSIRK